MSPIPRIGCHHMTMGFRDTNSRCLVATSCLSSTLASMHLPSLKMLETLEVGEKSAENWPKVAGCVKKMDGKIYN